ncbi:MAG: triose-phosphate isomerase [Sulfolobaceae archaeon]
MKPPIIVINYKVYENSFGRVGIEIAKGIDKLSKEYGIDIIVAVPATMINRIAAEVENISVYSQHVDSNPLGAYTGSIPPELIKEAGAKGSLINHSEKRILLNDLPELLVRMKGLGLESIVCVDNYSLVYPIGLLSPNAILIEPPELIGTGKAVSKVKPEVITNAVREIKKVSGVYLIAGAGITNEEDVYISIKLGADGVGAASAVMKSSSPISVVEGFIRGALRAMGKS